VFLRKDLTGFNGDPKYVTSEPACCNFSKLRSSIAGLYSWRARSASDPAIRRHLTEVADFSFRQALALNPRSPEAVFRSANHLMADQRPADTLLVAETASKLAPENGQLKSLAENLKHFLARKARNEQG
jgi:hypothetical protein